MREENTSRVTAADTTMVSFTIFIVSTENFAYHLVYVHVYGYV